MSDPLPPAAALPLERGRIDFVNLLAFNLPLERGRAAAGGRGGAHTPPVVLWFLPLPDRIHNERGALSRAT